jgi:hypothetical protein
VILVDYGVWGLNDATEHLAPEVLQRLKTLIRNGEVLGHPFVYGELKLGNAGSVHKTVIEKYLDLEMADVLPTHDVLGVINKHSLERKGITWHGAHLLASALASGAQLWTKTIPLQRVAAELGIAYDPEKESA